MNQHSSSGSSTGGIPTSDMGSAELQEREQAALGELGASSTDASIVQIIPVLRSGKDAFLACEQWVEPVVVGLSVERSVRGADGTSVLVVNDATLVDALTTTIQAKGLPGGTVAQPLEDAALLVGDSAAVGEFLAGEGGRATDIVRFIVGISGEASSADIQSLKEVLHTVCKRGKRPQLMLLAPAMAPELEELMQPYFQSSAVQIKHLFFEVGGELLAKGQALTDFIQGFNLPSTLIFCNQPSDADMVETVLKRTGITGRKLVGHVSPQKIAQSVAQVSSGEVTALVVTDAAARSIEVGDFKLVVNYSIPSDPEVYYHRTEPSRAASRLREVLNIVGPLDRANFFYLRKIVEASFESATPPSSEEIQRAKFAGFKARLLATSVTDPKAISALRALIEEDPQRSELISAALHLALQSLSAPTEIAEEREGEEHGRRDRFSRQHEDRRGGREPREQRDHREPREQREPRGQREREPRGERESRGEREPRGERPSGNFREQRERGHHEQQLPPARPRTIPQRSTRFYLGKGEADGLTRDQVITTLTNAGVSQEAILHVSMRKHFGFLDIDDKEAENSFKTLEAHSHQGSPVFVKRAITITSHVEVEEDDQREGVAPIELGGADASQLVEDGVES